MKILLTGAAGFLGWHPRFRLRTSTEHETVPVSRSTWPDLDRQIANADAVIHVAGVNLAAEQFTGMWSTPVAPGDHPRVCTAALPGGPGRDA